MDKLNKKLKVDIEYDLLLKNKLPILTENKDWLEIFGNVKDKEIMSDKQALQSIIEEKNQKSEMLESIKSQKKRAMAKIITLSDEINNNNKPENMSLLEEAKGSLDKMNEDIENLMYDLELIPRKTREANLKLLESTVKYSYAELLSREEELEKFSLELVELREKLRDCIIKKCDSEERISKIYSFLHNSLGNEKINQLDKDILT